jgi:carboxymethylenebutenolidase
MPQADLIQDAQALLGERDWSRRSALRVALGTGFAAAALPIAAQTVIKTSSDGLDVGEVTIPVGDFRMPAYRAAPKGRTGLRVGLVISEIFGVHEHIADVARRLAHLGYCAIAPELFIRQGDAGAYGEIAKLISEGVSKVPDAQVMGDLDATVAWAKAQGMDTAKLAITGFCWGGRITWLYAEHNPGIKAGVAWYGRLVGEASALNPTQPIDQVAQLAGPVLGLYGEADSGIPMDTIRAMQAALAKCNAVAQASRFVTYPGVGHAFNADYRASYVKAAAEDGWQRAIAWLREHGVA